MLAYIRVATKIAEQKITNLKRAANMSFEQANMPIAGDVLEEFVTIIREMFGKVSVTAANST